MTKQRHASDELVNTALELLGNDSLTAREKIMLALQMDAREDILELKTGMDTVNKHPFHRISTAQLRTLVIGFFGSIVMLNEISREWAIKLVGLLIALIGL
jgi:hypothetical protein